MQANLELRFYFFPPPVKIFQRMPIPVKTAPMSAYAMKWAAKSPQKLPVEPCIALLLALLYAPGIEFPAAIQVKSQFPVAVNSSRGPSAFRDGRMPLARMVGEIDVGVAVGTLPVDIVDDETAVLHFRRLHFPHRASKSAKECIAKSLFDL